MHYDHFVNYIKNTFEQLMGPDVPVNVEPVLKNNNVHLDALTILPKGACISPTIYLNDYYTQYQNGTSMNAIIREISDVYESTRDNFDFDKDILLNFSSARNLIAFKLVNRQTNSHLLQTVPFVPYMDLAIIFYLLLDSDHYGNATAIITNEHMAYWKTDPDVLYELAVHNTPRLLPVNFLSLEQQMRFLIIEDLKQEARQLRQKEHISEKGILSDQTIEMMADDLMLEYTGIPDRPTMYVLTNSNRCNGAAVILYEHTLKQAADVIGGNFYVLPSSIHELILLPDEDGVDVRSLQEMVCEINDQDVAITERLSDNVYFYDVESDELRCLETDSRK